MKNIQSPLHAAHTDYSASFPQALESSRRNALRRLVRCLFAEKIVNPDMLVFAPEGTSAWLPLWSQHGLLFFSNLEAAPAETFINRGTITHVEPNGVHSRIDDPAVLIELLRPTFDFTPSEEGVTALKDDVANSVRNDALARVHRDQWNADLRARIEAAGASGFVEYLRKEMSVHDAAIMLDQWGALEGHPFYPTWKSKPDLDDAAVAAYSPEFNASVPVRIAALRADMAHIERMPHVADYQHWFAQQFPEPWANWKSALRVKGLNEREWLPLPIHTWHLEHFVHIEYATEIEEGLLLLDGPDIDTWPTMSFRTMMPRLPEPVPFIKLPIALWLTSEQRSLQAKSIHMGPRFSAVIASILEKENGFDRTLEIFPEEVAVHYRHATRKEDRPGRHLSVAYRASRAAFQRTDGLLPVTVAALLTVSPHHGRPLITELIEGDGPRASVARVEAYFREYARIVTHPAIGIYLRYGIALEAHQQNTSVLFAADGMPHGMLIRDFGDGRAYARLLNARGLEIQPYVHPGILPTIFNDDIEPVRSFVLDACFVCHLHEVALLLSTEYGLRAGRLWDILRDETIRTFDRFKSDVELSLWETERHAFLEAPWATRSVLRMHLLKYVDYRMQHQVSNPLVAAHETGQ